MGKKRKPIKSQRGVSTTSIPKVKEPEKEVLQERIVHTIEKETPVASQEDDTPNPRYQNSSSLEKKLKTEMDFDEMEKSRMNKDRLIPTLYLSEEQELIVMNWKDHDIYGKRSISADELEALILRLENAGLDSEIIRNALIKAPLDDLKATLAWVLNH